MRLRAPQLDVPLDNPFQNDMLCRQPAVEALTNILKSSNEPFVISINAPWGYGKSTFLRMLESHLKANSLKTITFNAWESDYIDDPFVALLGDTESQLNSLKGRDNTSLQDKINKAKKYGGKIIRAAIPAAVKIGTAGIINLDELTESTIADAAEKFTQDQIDSYSEAKRSIASFRDELSGIAKSLYTNDSQLPLVFIIDELDRCRPTHAVRLLEIIKHFFSIDRISFVIALDPDQLGHSVKTLYGQEMDVNGYLKRFFDLELNLPKPNLEDFLNAQFSRFGLEEFFTIRTQYREAAYDKDQLQRIFKHLFSILKFSFREHERAFTLLSLAIRATPQNHHLHPVILGCLIILKIKNSTLYKDFIAGQARAETVQARAETVMEYLSTGLEGKKFAQSHHGYILEAELLCAQIQVHEQDNLYDKFSEQAKDQTLSREARDRAEIIAQVAKEKRFNHRHLNIDSIASKIDLVGDIR